MIKRSYDIFVSVLALIIMWPVMLAIALVIKIESPGPVIFKQRRYDINGDEFIIYKFRTMTVIDDESHLAYLKELSLGRPGNDPRITKVGRFLRRYSLDELPQFISVLKGDMSIVGPRPAYQFELSRYKKRQKERYNCKPGLTGLGQIYMHREYSYGGDIFDNMIRVDIEYCEKQSILLDLSIIIKTIIYGLKGDKFKAV